MSYQADFLVFILSLFANIRATVWPWHGAGPTDIYTYLLTYGHDAYQRLVGRGERSIRKMYGSSGMYQQIQLMSRLLAPDI